MTGHAGGGCRDDGGERRSQRRGTSGSARDDSRGQWTREDRMAWKNPCFVWMQYATKKVSVMSIGIAKILVMNKRDAHE